MCNKKVEGKQREKGSETKVKKRLESKRKLVRKWRENVQQKSEVGNQIANKVRK